MDKGVEYFGLHSFLASNIISNEYYPKLVAIIRISCRKQRKDWSRY